MFPAPQLTYPSHSILTDALEAWCFTHKEGRLRGLAYVPRVTKLESHRAWIEWSPGFTCSVTCMFFPLSLWSPWLVLLYFKNHRIGTSPLSRHHYFVLLVTKGLDLRVGLEKELRVMGQWGVCV